MNESFKKEFKRRLPRTLFLCAVAFAIGAGMALKEGSENASVVQKASSISPMAGISVGGAYKLVDHNGSEVTQAHYEEQYKLIYFGFSYCPAICPTELQKVSKTLKALGDEADNIQPIFITVDPERDTVETMKDYVSLFHPRLIGLTGSQEQINKVKKNYRVFAKKVQDPDSNDPEDYTMDHSSYIYLMSPDDQLLSMYRIQDNVAYMTNDIRKHLGAS